LGAQFNCIRTLDQWLRFPAQVGGGLLTLCGSRLHTRIVREPCWVREATLAYGLFMTSVMSWALMIAVIVVYLPLPSRPVLVGAAVACSLAAVVRTGDGCVVWWSG
jgi:hypothetical protein